MSLTLKVLHKFVTEFSPSALKCKANMKNNVNTTLNQVTTTLSYYEMKRFVEDALGFEVDKQPSAGEKQHTTLRVNTGPGSLQHGCRFKSAAFYATAEKEAAKYDIDAAYLLIAVNDLLDHILWQAQLYSRSQHEMKEITVNRSTPTMGELAALIAIRYGWSCHAELLRQGIVPEGFDDEVRTTLAYYKSTSNSGLTSGFAAGQLFSLRTLLAKLALQHPE